MKYQVLEKTLFRNNPGYRQRIVFRAAVVPGRKRLVYCTDNISLCNFPDLLFLYKAEHHTTAYDVPLIDNLHVLTRYNNKLVAPLLANIQDSDGTICLGSLARQKIRAGELKPEDAFFLTTFEECGGDLEYNLSAAEFARDYVYKWSVPDILTRILGHGYERYEGWS